MIHNNKTVAALIEAFPSGTAILDAQHVVLACNRAWEKYAEQLLDNNIFSAVGQRLFENGSLNSINQDDAIQQLDQLYDGTRSQFVNTYSFSTESLPLKVTVTANLFEVDGQAYFLVSTDAKVDTQTISLPSSNLTDSDFAILDLINEGVVIQDATGMTLVDNQASQRILGLTSDQQRGLKNTDPTWRIVNEDGSTMPVEEFPASRSMATGLPVNDAVMGVTTPTGGIRWLKVNSVPVTSCGDSEPSLCVITFVDITTQKDNENKFRNLYNRFQLALSASKIGVWHYRYEEDKLVWDDAQFEIYELPKSDFKGTNDSWAQMVHPEDRDHVAKKFDQCLEARNADWYSEFRIVTPTGKVKYIDSRAKFDLDANGEPTSITGLNIDITEVRETELALQIRGQELESLSRRLQLALDLEGNGVWFWNLLTDQISWDDRLFQLFGLKPESFESALSAWQKVAHPDDINVLKDTVNSAIETKKRQTAEYRVHLPNGTQRHIFTSVEVEFDLNGSPVLATGVNRDITDEKLLQEKMRASRERLQQFIEYLPVGAFFVEGNKLTFNTYAEEITGYSRDEISTTNKFMRAMFGTNQQKINKLYKQIEDNLTFGESLRLEIKTKNKQHRWIDFRGVQIEGGQAWVMKDITEQLVAEEELKRLAYYDVLTRLPNRTAVEHRLEEAISRAHRESAQVGVLLIDLDHFKNVNDTYGHPVGDQLLVKVAQRLTKRLRKEDVLGRIGGDEFLLLIEGVTNREQLARVADGLIRTCSQPMRLENSIKVRVKMSIGISMYPNDGEDGVHLFRNADTALYKAKALGRNKFQVYQPDLTQALESRVNIEHRIDRALVKQQFELYYQPIMRSECDTIVGAEALIRWRDPDVGIVSPAEFIPIAEETGLIIPIGRWVIEEVCRQLVKWQDFTNLCNVSVNLSAKQFTEIDIAKEIKSILEKNALNPAKLTLEITESILMENQLQTESALKQLKALGVSLAIDDFGTGYSSLAYLKHFDVDSLKIDRSFIKDLPDDYSDAQITSAIISMAQNLNLRVVAEGVESVDQKRFIQEHGCDFYQGFIKSKPVSAKQFTRLLTIDKKHVSE